MKPCQYALVLPSLPFFAATTLAGKPKHKHPAPAQPAPPPAPSSASVAPDAMPSASLQPFLDTHLDRILAPLDAEGLKHPDLITDFRASLADAMSKAVPARRPAFQAALGVCDALSNALNERRAALANLQGLASAKSSASLGVVSSVGHLSRKQIHTGRRARHEAAQTDVSFANSQKSRWVQRAVQLRQGIQ